MPVSVILNETIDAQYILFHDLHLNLCVHNLKIC